MAGLYQGQGNYDRCADESEAEALDRLFMQEYCADSNVREICILSTEGIFKHNISLYTSRTIPLGLCG